MAEAFPSGILDSVLKQLGSPIFESNKLNSWLGIQVRNLRSKLEPISGVIDDAEMLAVLFPKFFHEHVYELQRALYDLDDLLDEALTRSIPESRVVEKVRLRLSYLHFGLKLAHKMKKMTERIERIEEKFIKCNLIVSGNENLVSWKGILRYDPDCVKDDDDFHMIGREDDKKKVIEMLLSDGEKAVAIAGGTGVGKTTLCRAVYDDVEVEQKFDFRMWVCLERLARFSVVDVWREIIRKYGHREDQLGLESESIEPSSIERARRNIAKKGRILFVLDGLRYFDKRGTQIISDWFNLTASVPAGSRFFVTSSSTKPLDERYFLSHRLDGLSDQHWWLLFEKTALGTGLDRRPWKINLGKQIVNKCRGNPTLLRGVGTLLCREESRDTWEYFASDFHFDNHFDNYSKALEVSQILPRCHQSVGYLSLFLKHEFKYEVLLHQLSTQVFSTLSDRMQQILKDEFLHETGNVDHWDAKSSYMINKEWEECVLHLAGKESTAHICVEIDDIHEAVRHVSISRRSSPVDQQTYTIELPQKLIDDAVHRRGVLFLGATRMSVHTLDMLVSGLRHLRVLDLHDMGLMELPSSMGQLIHLRLIRLPRSIENLRNLKLLHINMCLDLTRMPSRISKLTCLERLDRFIVGPQNGGLRYLKNLDNLRGHLSIELPQQWKSSVIDAEQADLERKKDLTSLEFKWLGANHGGDRSDDHNLLDKLRPCTSTKSLFVLNYGGKKLPEWITILGTECLTELAISQCKACQVLPPFHCFKYLESLTLTSLEVKYLLSDVEPSTDLLFSLKKLRIGKMPKLEGWCRSNLHPEFYFIERMEIWNCPRLTVMPPDRDDVKIILQDVSIETLQLYDWSKSYSVTIASFPSICSLPDRFLTMWPHSFKIEDCKQLQKLRENKGKEVQVGEYDRLVKLRIKNCPAMEKLSETLGRMTYLQRLKIIKCSEQLDCLYGEDKDGMPWKALIHLNYLTIGGFENLKTLPKGLQHLSVLKKLKIRDCGDLKWEVGSLPESEHIKIKSCPQFSLRIEELKRVFPNIEVLE